eukprot:TRINITY_DN34175_c0_g1_i1.p1 TRINITY_DN34175_c0_g1~~TRINITY_DN34175_c0_g1_i1.p1  ORF type:complete len:600 (-),score=93.07 TRINITY_DN34175_c0_g1_i1:421-2220(-)
MAFSSVLNCGEVQELSAEEVNLAGHADGEHPSSVIFTACFYKFRKEVLQELENHASRVEQKVDEQRQMHEALVKAVAGTFQPVSSGAVNEDMHETAVCGIFSPQAVAALSPLLPTQHSSDDDHHEAKLGATVAVDNDSWDGSSHASSALVKVQTTAQRQIGAIATAGQEQPVKKRVLATDASPGTSQLLFMRISDIVSHGAFEATMLTVIGLNTLFLGLQLELKVRGLQNEPLDTGYQVVFSAIETVFCLIFLVELILRTLAKSFSTDTVWFLFDVVLVSLALLEEIDKNFNANMNMSNLTFFRILRLGKLMRMLRVIRLIRAFRELRIVVMSISSCLRSLGWTVFLLGAIMFLVATTILTTIASYEDRAYESSQAGDLRRLHYRNYGQTMLTLFMTITSGMDWYDACVPVNDLEPWLEILFAVYIAFIVFAIMNIVTGVFVDQAMKAVSQDQDLVFMEEKDRRAKIIRDIGEIFNEVTNGKEALSVQDMQSLIVRPEVRACFKQLDMEAWDLQTFLELVDSEDRLLDVESFVNGCLRVKGNAKNIDLIAMRYELQLTAHQQKKSLDSTKRVLNRIEQNAQLRKRRTGLPSTPATVVER